MKTIKQLLAEKGDRVFSITPEESVFEAIQRMAEHNVGALLVLNPAGRLAGIVSERDYIRRVSLEGKQSKETRVREIMTAKVLCARPDQSIQQSMAVMTDKRIRHLPVLDGDQLLGVVSIGDLVKAIIEDQQFTIQQLEHYIAG